MSDGGAEAEYSRILSAICDEKMRNGDGDGEW